MPDPNEAITKLVSVGAILVIGVLILGSVYAATPVDTKFQDDEQVTIDFQNNTQLDPGEDVFEWGASSTVTVNNSSGHTLTEGTDYEYYQSNGTIKWYNTADTSDGETATVDYEYEAPKQMAQSVIGPLASSFDLGAVLPIVMVAGMILFYLRGFGGGGSRRR